MVKGGERECTKNKERNREGGREEDCSRTERRVEVR